MIEGLVLKHIRHQIEQIIESHDHFVDRISSFFGDFGKEGECHKKIKFFDFIAALLFDRSTFTRSCCSELSIRTTPFRMNYIRSPRNMTSISFP